MSKHDCVPKLIGGDVELANFIVGENLSAQRSDFEASRLLLSEVDGLPRRGVPRYGPIGKPISNTAYDGYGYSSGSPGQGRDSQDWGRKYLCTNGGCIYIDLNHLELATPEVLSARDYQAVWTAMLRIARNAQVTANEQFSQDRRIVVLANNSDRQGHSYGGHQSFLMSRKAWDNMMRQRMIPSLFYLMAYQVSSIVFTGQGKIGSENGQPEVPFQISQRADFMETLIGEQTTFNRPLINTRDEPLCGPQSALSGAPLPGDKYARLHVIFYDTNMAPVATYLKVGVMQLILAMIEAEYLDDSLLLEKPLAALHTWSRDPDLNVQAALLTGEEITAVELQFRFLEQAKAFAASGGFTSVVVDADEIIRLWEDTLLKLRGRDFEGLRGRIDWVMKRALLEQARDENPQLDWDAPELVYLDQIYSSIDPADSLFLALEKVSLFEPVATEPEIERYLSNPPESTRAWTRAMLLRAIGAERVAKVDWDNIELKSGAYSRRTFVHLPDPLGATRARSETIFSGADDLPSLLQGLEAVGVTTEWRTPYSTGQAVSLLDS